MQHRAAAQAVSRGERRRRELIAVAEQVFLSSGFTATTMDAVAKTAGASKETLYRHFGDKEHLFAEVISNRAQRMREKLDTDFDRPHGMAAVLRDLGINLLTHMNHPDMVGLLRMIIAEAARDPALGQIFLTHGPERTRLRLAEYLQAAGQRGEFRGEPALAATLFLSAVIGAEHLLRLVGAGPSKMSEVETEARVDETVALFMARYAA